MDPLMSATLATHHRSTRDDLAWSALPDAPVVADPPPRMDRTRRRLAAALRGAATAVDGSRRAPTVAETGC